jgi:dienelactone hydrolase
MRWGAVIAAICIAAAPAPAASYTRARSPVIESFRLEPSRLCYGDPVRYRLSYAQLAGGLAAVKEAEMEASPPRPGMAPLDLGMLRPDRDELARHRAASGSLASGVRFWRPDENAPPGGADLQVRVKLVLGSGGEVSATTAVRYEDACPPPRPLATLAGGETGRVGFETVTPTNTEFLTGSAGGKPVVIWGHLALAPGGAGRMPAVILLPGSEGIGRREARWAEELTALGIAAFMVDSLTGRDLEGATAGLHTGAIIVDAYRALGLLATHPRLDPERIALMGFSRGGVVTLFSSLTRFHRMHGPAGVRFAVHLPFYPGCHVTYLDEEQVTDRPIRIFHGAADDWTPIGPCREYAQRLRRAGKDVRLRELPGAPHAFDDPSLPARQHWPEAVNPSRCFFLELPGGQLVSRETGRPLEPGDPCFSRGATVGYRADAHHRVIREVRDLLTAIFRLAR